MVAMNRRGKVIALPTAAVGLVVLIAAGIVGKDRIRRWWYQVDAVALLMEGCELTVAMEENKIPEREQRLQRIVALQVAAGRTDHALKTMNALRSEYARIVSLRKIAFTQAQMGQIDEARQTQARLHENGSRHYEVINREIGIWQVRNGHLEEARRTANGIQLKEFAVPVLTELALEQANAGSTAAAASFSKALEAAESIEETQRGHALLGLVRAQKTLGGQDVARRLLEKVLLAIEGCEEVWAKIHNLREAAVEMHELGDSEAAIRLFDRALAEVSKINTGVVHGNQLIALKLIAVDQTRLDMFQHSFATLERMEMRSVFDSGAKEEGLRDIALAQIERGDIDGAARTALLIREFTQYRDDALVEIATVLTKGGNAPQGVVTCEQIQNKSRKAEALLRVATLQALKGDRKAAVETAELTRFLKNEEPLGILPISEFAYDRCETWGELYEPWFTGASAHAASERACELGSAAIRLQVALGKSDWSAYPEAFKEGWDDVVYAIARGQAQAGDEIGAVSWARKMEDPGKRGWAFVGVADGILEKQGRVIERD